jgi:hypothetical protein
LVILSEYGCAWFDYNPPGDNFGQVFLSSTISRQFDFVLMPPVFPPVDLDFANRDPQD